MPDLRPPVLLLGALTNVCIGALCAQDAPQLAAALRRLVAYQPGKTVPTDPAVLAAERELGKAMAKLVHDGGADGQAGQARSDVAKELARLCTERGEALSPTAKAPVRDADPLLRTLVRFATERALTTDPAHTTAHPAASAFPGTVPADAAVVTKAITIDLAVPGRHSTGLYAAPGAVVRIVCASPPPKGVRVRLGAHSDNIERRPRWPRLPRISRTFDMSTAETVAANALGGLVYIEAPKDGSGTLRVEISGAVEAPLFVLGTTDAAAWREHGRSLPAPWAELATSKVVLTVPSTAIRDLEDPTAVLHFWDRVLDGAADLAARPRDRERPERYVADIEISAGAMHSGYPIMTHLDAARDMVSLEHMQKGPWGLFHELGHNHQNRDWTFTGTGEVTVNLFSLHLCETLCNKPWHDAWGGNVGRAKQRLGKVLALDQKPWGGDGDGKADLSLRLLMYSQLQQEFGWDAFARCFAAYRALPDDERPKTDDQKRDQWLVRFSRTVGRDLSDFFVAWGVATSEAARATLHDLPPWMPVDWPGAR